MRVVSCKLRNFASYKELYFNFENQGLTLIQGPTGSGKSTLCDAIPWVLFGRTAKDGTVDEIRSWNTEEPTRGEILISTAPGVIYRITRTRGKNANDLYIEDCMYMTTPTRGKDLNDTQKRINSLLGIDSALYLSGAYFHEFSQTAQFFTTTAKNRRIICEQLVDLSLAKNLQVKLAEDKKEHTRVQKSFADKIQLYADRIQQLSRPNDYETKFLDFEENKKTTLEAINKEQLMLEVNITAADQFEKWNRELEEIVSHSSLECPTCGHTTTSDEIDGLKDTIDRAETQNYSIKYQLINLAKSYKVEATRENVYGELILKIDKDLKAAQDSLGVNENALAAITFKLADIELLLEVVESFRGVTIKNTIQNLENQTNKLLTDHFDAEIKVQFEIADADKLDVTILKDSNTCSYAQLSKGQRQLLKLAFGVSVMRQVSNQQGVTFNTIFIDEALEGLDENMKVKTYGLLQSLSQEVESVFVVDHSEALKSMFTRSYEVQLVSGNSIINEKS